MCVCGGGVDHVCTGACVCASVYKPMVSQPQTYFLRSTSTLVFETCFLTVTWNTPIGHAVWPTSPGESACLCLPSTRIQSVRHSSRLALFLTRVPGMEPVSLFPTAPSSQPRLLNTLQGIVATDAYRHTGCSVISVETG